jgi:hypothetical protein
MGKTGGQEEFLGMRGITLSSNRINKVGLIKLIFF